MTTIYINNFTILICAALALAGCDEKSPQASSIDAKPYEVHCTESLPQFTLGPNSKPTKAQEAALCSCIWQELGDWERKASKKISQGKESEVSGLNMRAFPSRFGNAVDKCGGKNI